MNPTIKDIEEVLHPVAKNFTPPGTSVSSVVHQWISAITYETDLFAKIRGVDVEEIITVLRDKNIYKSKNSFKLLVRSSINIKPIAKPKFKFIDLFAGIGGMRLGFESVGGVSVFSSEYEKNAQETYRQNFGELPFGDITQISEKDIPDHDVLLAGFPCQPFSHAGLKLGIDDTRGTLFFDIARILAEKQPKFALLENVKGLISHDKGHTLKTILQTLSEIGYRCVIDNNLIIEGDLNKIKKQALKMVLRSRDFGVPQNRQRIYIVLWHKSFDIHFQYPEPPFLTVRVSDILEENPEEKYTISDKLWDGHKRRKTDNKIKGKGFGFGIVIPDSEYTNTISARYYKDGSEILLEQKNKNPRKLTPREAARLQGFPEKFKLNKSEVQTYKQFGNSVTVPVVNSIANQIIKQL